MKTPKTLQENQRTMQHLKIIAYGALVLGVLSIISVMFLFLVIVPGLSNSINLQSQLQRSGNLSSHVSVSGNLSSSVQTQGSFGSTIAGIDDPLNNSALAVINNAPNSYFENAGEEYINGSLSDPIYPNANKVQGFTSNNKTSVVYLGSIDCVFCGENRWAMALALSRFGSFSKLFIGYSSFGDYDLPTLYWTADNYNGSTDEIGSYYSSNIINFLPIEDTHPITGGFVLNPISTIQHNVDSKGNETYIKEFDYILNLSNNKTTAFQGTPYTIWGEYQFSGADAVVFGNSTPTGSTLPLTYMTHAQVLSQLANPTDQFAQGEYAAADVYVAALCKSINNNASVCSLPAIITIESVLK